MSPSDFKLSFKRPLYLYNNTRKIPHWETSMNAIPTHDYVRVAPSIPNTKGAVWSELQNNHSDWQVELALSIFGRSYVGGEGLALWYTKERGAGGPAMGSREWWHGVGIIFDTADVHSEPRRHTPMTYLALNDGTKSFADAAADTSKISGNCTIFYRNHPGAVYIRVTYLSRTLKVEYDLGRKFRPQQVPHFTECMTVPNVDLPQGYYFGLSSETSEHFMDDHDVYTFETYELNPKARRGKTDHLDLTEEQRKKIDSSSEKVEVVIGEETTLEPTEEEQTNSNIALTAIRETQLHVLDALSKLALRLDHLDLNSALRDAKSSATSAPASAPVTCASPDDVAQIRRDIVALVGSVAKVGNRVDELGGKVDSVERSEGAVVEVRKEVEKLQEIVRRQAQFVVGTVQETKAKNEESRSNLSWWLWLGGGYALFWAGVTVFHMYAPERREKKFI
ncbi:concanavalin A-like lectin/glucanase [Gonapodya prolifera JEL478]|uniref:Concanavalin A-like lectin/glucanase n=1 Tax=Gonapodya prolifera (strain JEL478) TaxID=1344416 RepID=A0A139A7L6_GONPJ|nr:concanavalin A-like lectin/glucanase [Gonapodya prolifera JEL478]|eukprot:KXS12435.1 concanavalin A-like lectin/glucanase [Gonapodya prolifera JEL478]